MKNKAIFKFNGGYPVMLCSGCSAIIKTIAEMNEDEVEAMKGRRLLEPKYCELCKKDKRKEDDKSIRNTNRQPHYA